MSFDLDKLIRDLNELLESIGESDVYKQTTGSSKIMGFDVSTNVSVKVGLLESLGQPNHNKLPGNELLDVFENDDSVKLVALIPGIEKEDIETNVADGFIEMKIRKGDSDFCRNIPCNVKPDRITVASMTCNNSVLEIVFKKGDADVYS